MTGFSNLHAATDDNTGASFDCDKAVNDLLKEDPEDARGSKEVILLGQEGINAAWKFWLSFLALSDLL